jgi:hypothetical protein
VAAVGDKLAALHNRTAAVDRTAAVVADRTAAAITNS